MPQFKLRQRLLSFGDDFDIADSEGRPAYHVDGKVFRLRHTSVIEDLDGAEVATVRQKLIAVRKTMLISRNDDTIATIRKALIAPLRDKYMIDVEGGEALVATGSILDHEYIVRRGDDEVAQVSKRWFTIRDTYGVDIADGEDVGLLLAVVVAIDELANEPDDEE